MSCSVLIGFWKTYQQNFLWENTGFFVSLSAIDVYNREEMCSKYVEKYLIF